MGRGKRCVVHHQQIALSQMLERRSDRLCRALRSAFIENLRQLWEAADLTDHKPAKLHHARREHARELTDA